MASTFIQLSLSFLLLLLTSPFSCAKHANNHHHLAEKLIRSLNLFPTDSINIASPDPSFVAQKIVEKSFCFPSLNNSGVSVEDLGHHAGYYSLPHSKAARWALQCCPYKLVPWLLLGLIVIILGIYIVPILLF